MNILIAGMGRSGSTALFNIVRELLKDTDLYSHHEFEFDMGAQKTNNILKTHYKEYDDWPDIILTARRNMIDVLASFKKFHGRYSSDPPEVWVKRFLEWHEKWVDRTDYEMEYDRFVCAPITIIKEIAAVIGVKDYDAEEIFKTVDSYKQLKVAKDFDPKTLLHPTHITYSTRDVLDTQELKVVNEIAGEWQEKYNYE